MQVLAGKYQLMEQIGHGAYSVVWRAKNIKTNRFVAIKELHNVFDKDILKRLLREIRLLRHFEGHQNVRSHSLWLQIKKYSGFQQKSKIFLRFSKSRVGIMVPDVTLELFQKEIVKIVELFTTKDRGHFDEVFLVCELMDMDLHKLINSDTQVSMDHVRLFMYQILVGLKSLHSAHVLHRDLKPKNILVNKSGDLRICDLGMGRKSEIGRASLKMTMLSEVATPYYRAPDGILNTPSSVSKKRRGSVEEDLDGKNRSRTRADEHATAKGNMAASSQPNYTAAVDMWACGCILAELLLRKPLFPGKNNKELLEMICSILGTPEESLMERIPDGGYKRHLLSIPTLDPTEWKHVFPESADADAINLLARLLVWDPDKRITVDQALEHPFLDDLHDPDEEPTCDAFVFAEDDEEKDPRDLSQYRNLIFDEIEQYSR